MAKIYGQELAEQIKKDLERTNQTINNRWERINQGLTDMDDCFMSAKTNSQSIDEYNMQLEILKGDGLMEIFVLVSPEGKTYQPRWVNTQWGSKIVVNGIFAASKKALIKKTEKIGYTQGVKKVPCWTKFISGSGGGLCGVYSGRYEIVRQHTNMVTGEYVGYDD